MLVRFKGIIRSLCINPIQWLVKSFQEYLLLFLKLVRFSNRGNLSIKFFVIVLLSTNVVTFLNQKDFESVLASIAVDIVLMFFGYILFLVFQYIPNVIFLKRIKPIRDKINTIIKDDFYNIDFSSLYELNNYDKYFNLSEIPTKNLLRLWVYRLEVQRNSYLLLAPIGYIIWSMIGMYFSMIKIPTIVDIYQSLLSIVQSKNYVFELFKWLFITIVITDEMVNINNDIGKLQLLLDLDVVTQSDDRVIQ